jgi:hypothetical protein
VRCRKTYLCGFPYDGSIRQGFPCRPNLDFLISLSVDLKYTENTCFPTGRLMPKSTAERPQPAPSGKYRRLVPGSYRNCQILGIPLVLAQTFNGAGLTHLLPFCPNLTSPSLRDVGSPHREVASVTISGQPGGTSNEAWAFICGISPRRSAGISSRDLVYTGRHFPLSPPPPVQPGPAAFYLLATAF